LHLSFSSQRCFPRLLCNILHFLLSLALTSLVFMSMIRWSGRPSERYGTLRRTFLGWGWMP
jgi:hypothetical protein